MARPRRAHETEFCIRRNEIALHQPERLYRFDDADERKLASRVTATTAGSIAIRARGSTSVVSAPVGRGLACSWLTATAASPSIIRVMARRSASDIARMACASATPACSLSRQMGRLMPNIAIQPGPQPS